jgi:hypothetical protein
MFPPPELSESDQRTIFPEFVLSTLAEVAEIEAFALSDILESR